MTAVTYRIFHEKMFYFDQVRAHHLYLYWDPDGGAVLHLSTEGPGDGSQQDLLLAKVILRGLQLQLSSLGPDVHRLGGVEKFPFTSFTWPILFAEVKPCLVFALLRHVGLQQDLKPELAVSGLEEVNQTPDWRLVSIQDLSPEYIQEVLEH